MLREGEHHLQLSGEEVEDRHHNDNLVVVEGDKERNYQEQDFCPGVVGVKVGLEDDFQWLWKEEMEIEDVCHWKQCRWIEEET